jgi:hypothetical protein
VQQDQAIYEATVVNYRQTVLVAFQQVEDNLAAVRILSDVIHEQDARVKPTVRTINLVSAVDSLSSVAGIRACLLISALVGCTFIPSWFERLACPGESTAMPSAAAIATTVRKQFRRFIMHSLTCIQSTRLADIGLRQMRRNVCSYSRIASGHWVSEEKLAETPVPGLIRGSH